MPYEIKQFLLYFLLVGLPLAGITLYVSLLAMERARRKFKEEVEAALRALSEESAGKEEKEVPETGSREREAGEELNGELDRIQREMREKEAHSVNGEKEVGLKKETIAEAGPEKMSQLLSTIMRKEE